MRKILLIYFLLTKIHSTCFAQSIDTSVEVRLQIIIKQDKRLIGGLALGISVINHSDKDIYIPNFNRIGIHFYDNSSSFWRELDLYALDGSGNIPYWASNEVLKRSYNIPDNIISTYYKDYIKSIHNYQEIIYENYLGEKQKMHLLGEHLFLKAKQGIDNYCVLPIDKLLSKKVDYKITFNTEIRDSVVVDKSISDFYPVCPAQILIYHIYTPEKLVSNTIYFSTKDSIAP